MAVAGSSCKLTHATEKDRAELLTLCAWADAAGIPYVRVFGGGTWGQPLSEADYDSAAGFVNQWRQEKSARHWRVELLMETHDAFSASAPCRKLNELLAEPVNLIWDSHHTWRLGGEAPPHSWAQLAPWIRHVHIKDSVDCPSARHPFTYVLPGEGQMPLAEVISVLRENNFAGHTSLEWELMWHPYLPPLREALTQLQKQPWYQITVDESHTPALAS
jgi:sugar phosphate isomerase/epimerase